MKICVFGLGYIGLPTALLFAKHGHEVIGYDIDKNKVDKIDKGNIPFKEKGLEELFKDAKLNFRATETPEKSDVFLIAVPTPITKDKKCDLSYVSSAVDKIRDYLEDDNLVILESTVSPGTTEKINKVLKKSGKNISLAYVSEKAIPGNTIYEMINNDRIIGGIDKESSEKARKIYLSFVKGEIIVTDAKTAETVKLMENTFRDVNIALANEFALMSEKIGIDVKEAIKLANRHPRVNILNPGPGVGGHCIPIDPWFLIEKYTESKIMKSAREINDQMPYHVFEKIKERVKNIENPVIAILGVAYKPNIDDYRESPSLKVIELCKNEGYEVKIHDPYVKTFPYRLEDDLEKVLEETDYAVVMVEHNKYSSIIKNNQIIIF